MKASLKVREEQKPLIRAKLPLHLLGLPLFTGVTSGAPEELALHLGTYADAGPSFRVSYKPNKVGSPFSVLVKTGFGVWGSPHGAALAMSAELNFSSTGTPSFSLRMKPKLGDFGFRKDTRSITVALVQSADKGGGDSAASFEQKMESIDMGGSGKKQEEGLRALYGHEDHPHNYGLPNGPLPANESPTGKMANGVVGVSSGVFVKEKIQSYSNGKLEKGDVIKADGKSMDHMKECSDSGSTDDGFTPVYDDREQGSRAMMRVGGVGELQREESWLRSTSKGWSMSAHSSLPVGKKAAVKVRWQVKFGSELFYNVRSGFRITDVSLPTLTCDKVSIEALDRFKRFRAVPSFDAADITIPGFAYTDEENQQMSRIAAMCVSMRYQLQLLHSENKMLKKTMDELRTDLSSKRTPAKASELLLKEENALRSQLFEELSGSGTATGNSKANSNSRVKSRDASHNKDISQKSESKDGVRSGGAKVPSSTVTDFTGTVDPVSEELKKAIMNATGGS